MQATRCNRAPVVVPPTSAGPTLATGARVPPPPDTILGLP